MCRLINEQDDCIYRQFLFSVVESDPKYEVRRLGGDIWTEDPFNPLVIEWNPLTLDGSNYVRVDLISL